MDNPIANISYPQQNCLYRRSETVNETNMLRLLQAIFRYTKYRGKFLLGVEYIRA